MCYVLTLKHSFGFRKSAKTWIGFYGAFKIWFKGVESYKDEYILNINQYIVLRRVQCIPYIDRVYGL